MARHAVIGNGSLAVGIDENGLVHDFYYPYVGLENLNNARNIAHQIGVWVDGKFSWLAESAWTNNVQISSESMTVLTTHFNDNLKIELKIDTYIDYRNNILTRNVKVINHNDKEIDFRIFFHQIFQISASGRADTALYEPDGHYLIDYKGRCTILIKGQFADGKAFDQYAVGNYGIEGKEGTYKDSEDGELSMSPVEHAGVDSVIRLSRKISNNSEEKLNYWLIAADSQYSVHKINDIYLNEPEEVRRAKNNEYWSNWLEPIRDKITIVDEKYKDLLLKSIFTIKSHIDKHGGIIASCDSSIYNYGRDYYSYVWPRDGAFALWPFIRLGLFSEAKKFFEFCKDIITPDGYLMHKFQPDKAIGSTWHPSVHGKNKELPIQEDETALIIFMLGEYLDYSQDDDFVRSMYDGLIRPMCNFMTDFIDEQTGLPHASYDLWEQKFLTTTFSTAATYKALVVGAKIADKYSFHDDKDKWLHSAASLKKHSNAFFDSERGIFRKGFLLQEDGSLNFDNVLDISSFYGAFMFDYASNDEQIKRSAKRIEEIMLDFSPSGGTPRYEYDGYFQSKNPYKGNPWFVTTLWMGQYYNQIGDTDKASSYLDWTVKNALPSGVLSEQINPEDSSVVGVTPLVWSHAEFINLVLDLNSI